jgi:hypothetical protein
MGNGEWMYLGMEGVSDWPVKYVSEEIKIDK